MRTELYLRMRLIRTYTNSTCNIIHLPTASSWTSTASHLPPKSGVGLSFTSCSAVPRHRTACFGNRL